MPGSVGDMVARQATRQLLGRRRELEWLWSLVDADLPRVVHVHGVPGIGKSSLLRLLGEKASDVGCRVISLEGRALEPTGQAILRALRSELGVDAQQTDALARALGAAGERVIVMLDDYEELRLADRWLRHSLMPVLPRNVRVVLAGRVRPALAWVTEAGWDQVFDALELGAMDTADALELLHRSGISVVRARRVADQVQRHPLALRLAVAALRERRDLAMDDDALQQALEQLTDMVLADVREPRLRDAAAAAALVRRVTLPVLAAIFPESDPDLLMEDLRQLAFIDTAHDGLRVHDAVRPALERYLRARDPQRHERLLRDVWRQLVAGSGAGGQKQLWRDTADILYLIQNPVVREAFFPSGTSRFTVAPASPADGRAIRQIVQRHEGSTAAETLLRWWDRLPSAFHVAVDGHGDCAGFHCSLDPSEVSSRSLVDDPLTAAWRAHLRERPLPPGQRALFLRRWLDREHGEQPSDVQAACWLDIKRIYMEKRPSLRRVYLAVVDFDAYAAVAAQLGFRPLPDASVEIDGQCHHSACLDFGPGSVDGWLADLAARELGVEREGPLLDVGSHELVLRSGRTELTPLELGLLRYLMDRDGQAVSRDALLRDVWQSVASKSSNVVDAVVASVRRKLGDEAHRIQTVKGVGYRYRGSSPA